jgi:hypothetical protein
METGRRGEGEKRRSDAATAHLPFSLSPPSRVSASPRPRVLLSPSPLLINLPYNDFLASKP